MKTIYILLSAILLNITLFLSCKKSKDNGTEIYINGIDVTPAVNFPVVFGTKPSKAINVSVTNIATKDITVNFQAQPEKASYYNQLNSTNYTLLPDTCYKLSGKAVKINAGKAISNSISIDMISFASLKRGVTYILPVSITEVSSEKVVESLRTAYYLINVASETTVINAKDNFFNVRFSSATNAPLKNMKAMTIQININANSFTFISGLIALGQASIFRIGDAGILPNQIQAIIPNESLPLGQGLINRATVNPPLNTGKWYKLAYVYDGTTVKVYIDGVLRSETPASGAFDLTSGNFRIGYDWDNTRSLDGMMSECRIWSKALTVGEIISNGCEVDPKSAALEAYWKFNEGSGNIANDATGHGHVATANATLKWIAKETCQ